MNMNSIIELISLMPNISSSTACAAWSSCLWDDQFERGGRSCVNVDVDCSVETLETEAERGDVKHGKSRRWWQQTDSHRRWMNNIEQINRRLKLAETSRKRYQRNDCVVLPTSAADFSLCSDLWSGNVSAHAVTYIPVKAEFAKSAEMTKKIWQETRGLYQLNGCIAACQNYTTG